MSNKVFEDAPQPSGGAVDRIRKQARQLAYDVRYKVKGKFKEGQKTSPAALKRAYMQQLGASSAPGPVKAMAQKMLIGEAYDMIDISSSLEGLKESVFANVFSEGKTTVLRVSDPRAKTTYYRSYNNYEAASAKKRELEKKGLKVEMTGRKDEDTYDRKGLSGEKKAKKDYDGDGKIESGTAEYMGSRDKAIKKAMAKEEVIYEKDENGKKLDVMKGKNKINVNPSLGEQIKAELAAISQKKIEEANAAVAQQAADAAAAAEDKAKKLKIKALEQEKKAIQQEECDTCDKDEKSKGDIKAEDPRSMPAKINLAKNKLRAMGLKMSYDMPTISPTKGQKLNMYGEAVYGGTPKKDTRMTVTAADKKGNTKAYQNYKAGDKRYKAADHMGEELSIDDQMRISREAAAKRKPYKDGDHQRARAKQLKNVAKNAKKDTRTDAQKMADAYASPRKGPLGATRAD